MFKTKLSLRKKTLASYSKRLSNMINSGCKSFGKRGLCFVDKKTTQVVVKQFLSSLVNETSPRKLILN